MKTTKAIMAAALAGLAALAARTETAEVKMLDGERWWGAANFFGTNMPFTAATRLKIDLRKENYSNQCASMLVSDLGRVVWSAAQSVIEFKDGAITIDADAPVSVEETGGTLADAFRLASRKRFPPSGKSPEPLFFTAPQYNTWIELTYHQNEKDILAYAKSMLDNGLPPGVLMIDDTWQLGYGEWEFDPRRFSDPKGMIDALHAMGFKVMLWMCPYVSADTPPFRRIETGVNPDDVNGYPTRGGFLADPTTGETKPLKWWNGYSAFLDFSHPNARDWFKEQLDRLSRDFGVDGFKFDGGDFSAYDVPCVKAHDPAATSASLNKGYFAFALDVPFGEARNVWDMQGLPLVVRLHDKPHDWPALHRIVADMIGAGLLGYPFVCPDMVGGGSWTAFLPGAPFDPELFVRSAQIHAFAPMMQISASPWRVLDAEHQRIFKEAVATRQKFAGEIAALAEEAGRTGEPILRNLEYNYPRQGYSDVIDEFMLGRGILVAPVLDKGVTEREVAIPPGTWLGDDGKTVVGPAKIKVSAPLSRIPHWVKR